MDRTPEVIMEAEEEKEVEGIERLKASPLMDFRWGVPPGASSRTGKSVRGGESIRDALNRDGLMHGQGESTGSTHDDHAAGHMLLEEGGYGVINVPGDVFDGDVRHFMHGIVRSVYRLEPPRNMLMAAVYRILSNLADEDVYPGQEAVVVGIVLGAAQAHGIQIKTHPRDLAKEIGVRYLTLLRVRKAAAAEFARLGAFLDDPEEPG